MNPFNVCYANDNSALIPAMWAMEGLAILEENMVMSRLVHRDFSPIVAEYGDVVNTRRPGTFQSKRKTDTDNITLQDASATNVRVPLDQHFYTSFTIKDGEASKSFQDLIEIYLLPGMQSIARSVDRALLGRVHQFLPNAVGRLGGLHSSNAKDVLLEAREIMNINKAYPNGRNLVLGPQAETQMLKNDLFISAEKRGDQGTALRDASLGRVLGFDTFMDQNTPGIGNVNADVAAGTVTNAAAAGVAASQTVAITGHEVVAGEYVVMEDDGQPTYATAATVGAGDTTAVTLSAALVNDVAAASAVRAYPACAVSGGFAIDWAKEVVVTGYTNAPQVGQLIAFGAGGARRVYTIIVADGGNLLLDRPLEVALVNAQAAFPGPAGSLNFAFHRDALALVSRPLALPPSDTGVRSQVGVYNDVAMRVSMQYDINAQGTIVTLDMLCGVAVLDVNLGSIVLG